MSICFSKKFLLFSSIVAASLIFIFSVANAGAQGLTLSPSATTGQAISAENTTITLITIRLILVIGLVITGIVALMSGHHWLNAEGNTKKAKENKLMLGRMLLIITAIFFALILFRVFIPDYSVLTL